MAIKTGTAGNDLLIGTAANDTLSGLAGRDTLSGLDGNDLLDGGLDIDRLVGGLGNDTYVVNVSTDVVVEALGAGTDTVRSTASYVLAANVENLVLLGTGTLNGTGNALNNSLVGNAGRNGLYGGAGNDVLNGAAGNDTLVGGLGHDTYVVGVGDTVVEAASAGTDTVRAALSYTLGANLERLVLLGTADLNGTGNALANYLAGNAGKNILNGGAGNDSLIGGGGNDTLIGGLGDDRMDGGAGIDTVSYATASAGVFIGLHTSAALDTGTVGKDALVNVENLIGSGFNDVIFTGAGANVLNGGAGVDWVSYFYAGTPVTVSLALTTAQNTGGGGIDTLAGFENLAGTVGADVLTGNAGNNTLFGYNGNDTLNGGAGIDTAYFWQATGPLTINLNLAGSQSIGSGDTVRLSSIENLLGGTYDDSLIGNGVANVLDGYSGNDTLTGGLGDDQLVGGWGNDVLNGDGGRDLFVFNTTPNASTNNDRITSFVVVDDTIGLENAVFTALTVTGTLAAADFAKFASGAAAATVGAAVNIVYDQGTGELYYDPNGGDATGRVEFATLANSPDTLTNADFIVT